MLYGQKVSLRVATRADLPHYVRWLNDPEICRFLNRREPLSLEQEEVWFERMQQANRSAELGIFIGEKHLWGQGLGADAMRTLLRHGFDALNLHRICLRVYANNPRAIHLYKKLGFQHEGRAREAEFRDGQYHDVLLMSMLEDEWQQQR